MIATCLEIGIVFGLMERELWILAYIMLQIILIPRIWPNFKTILHCFKRPRTGLKAMIGLPIIHTFR